MRHSPKVKFDQGATPEESLVSFSSSYQYGTDLMKLAQLPSTTILSSHDRDEAKRWLNSMPFASKYLFSPTSTMAEQLKGQWNTLPMGKKKGGLCQRNPQMAKQIIEKFGSFLSFLIRLYPSVTGQAYAKHSLTTFTNSRLEIFIHI